MTQEEKELLLKDLCARLPYGVIIQQSAKYDISKKKEWESNSDYITHDYKCIGMDKDGYLRYDSFRGEAEILPLESFLTGQICRPYLRRLSNMNSVEEQEYSDLAKEMCLKECWIPCYSTLEWLNAHHFDYRGLIEKGLALEAPEGMYNIKEE